MDLVLIYYFCIVKQIVVDIPDNKVPFFIELIKNLGFVKKINVSEEPTKTEILDDLEQTLTQLKKGTLKTIKAKDFLNEL